MKDTLVVNILGGPGIGKSTTAAGVFSLLKQHNVNCELVTEFAKDLVWEKRDRTLDNQFYISAKQYHKLWRVASQVDVIVTDSPLILGTVYSEEESLNNALLHGFSKFNNMNFVLERTKEYNPSGRNQTEDEAKEFDTKIKSTLRKYNIKFKALNHYRTCGYINEIINRVMEKLNRENPIYFIGVYGIDMF